MIIANILFGLICLGHIMMIIATIKDLLPDKDEIEFQRKMCEIEKEIFK